jgi:hypothetical protein
MERPIWIRHGSSRGAGCMPTHATAPYPIGWGQLKRLTDLSAGVTPETSTAARSSESVAQSARDP